MRPLAVVKTDRRTDGARRLAPNHAHRGYYDWPLAPSVRRLASQALAENDAKDSMRDSYAIPSRILKPNIYYKAHNFAPEPIGSELSRRKPRQLSLPRDGGRRRRTRQSRGQRPAGSDGDVAPAGTDRPRRLSLNKPGAGMVEDGSCEG
jgi:hypothetical protein